MERRLPENLQNRVQKITSVIAAFFCILACIMLIGCKGTEFFDEIPADFALHTEATQENTANKDETEVTVLKLEELTGPAVFLMEEAQDYGYRSLSAGEQIWYRDMEQILGSYAESGGLSRNGLEAGVDESHIDRIFQCVLLDHPELFYVEGYAYTKYTAGEELIAVEFSGAYSMDRETAQERKAQIEASVAEILSGISPDCSQYEKVKYVYDTIITNTEYQLDAPDNQNIYSVFIHRLSVCQGYAKATQYLLNKLGVECTLVLGTVEPGEGHAWNLVRVDGKYYFVDTTWGDASYRMENKAPGEADIATINYDYLNVTSRELLKTHVIGGVVPVPECVATEDNYYIREGLLVTSFDRLQLEALFRKCRNAGHSNVTIKCASPECYREIKEALVDQKEIFDYMQGTEGSVAFSANEQQQLSLSFWVTNE